MEIEFEEKPDVAHLCRLCGNTDNQLMPIFKGEGLEHNIPHKIKKHLPIIRISEADKLPLHICYQCASALISWSSLYEGCLIVEQRLRELLNEKYQAEPFENDCVDFHGDNLPDDETTKPTFSVENMIVKVMSDEPVESDVDNSEDIATNIKNKKCAESKTNNKQGQPENVAYRITSNGAAQHPKMEDVPRSATCESDETEINLRCDLCPMVFVEKRKLLSHLRTKHYNVRELLVPRPSRRTSPKKESHFCVSPGRMISLAETANRDTALPCAECDKVFKTVRGLRNHQVIHKPFYDSDTEKKVEKGTLKRIAKPIILRCLECHQTFSTRGLLMRHQKKHVAKSEFTCEKCKKQFHSDRLLRRHVRDMHQGPKDSVNGERDGEEKEDPFTKWYLVVNGKKHLKCDQCIYNTLCYHKGRFLEHYRIHTGERPFACDTCGKQFRTKTLMHKHVLFVHEGVKEHACDICGRRFSDKRYMEEHRRIHTGERPFVCDMCGKTFKQSASLFMHKELHKGLRKHTCDICGNRFTTRSSLNIHIKRHIGERNFACSTCEKAFVDRKHLRDHMTVHSEERPWSCELCGARFKLAKHLRQHGRTHKRVTDVD